jgi:hypothetical protein
MAEHKSSDLVILLFEAVAKAHPHKAEECRREIERVRARQAWQVMQQTGVGPTFYVDQVALEEAGWPPEERKTGAPFDD